MTELLDLAFPTACHGCGAPGGEVLCPRCLAEIALSTSREDLEEHGGIKAGSRPAQGFSGFRAAGPYEGLLREAVLALKSSRRPFAAPLALLMMAAAGNDPAYIAPDAVCFVPSTRAKVLERGYNPAEVLARIISGRTGRPIVACLAKTRETEDQDALSRAARFPNVNGAFRARASDVRGGRILLVDDVLTTGATAGSCSEALLSAGARSVHVLVAAEATHGERYRG